MNTCLFDSKQKRLCATLFCLSACQNLYMFVRGTHPENDGTQNSVFAPSFWGEIGLGPGIKEPCNTTCVIHRWKAKIQAS